MKYLMIGLSMAVLALFLSACLKGTVPNKSAAVVSRQPSISYDVSATKAKLPPPKPTAPASTDGDDGDGGGGIQQVPIKK